MLKKSHQQNKTIPIATYRLQFNHLFTLNDATRLVPYLDDLGISHIYASPLLKAVPGSMHGYDVCDYSQINPEIGSEEDLTNLSHELKKRGMGIILDIVPNHMGIQSPENKWWWDVLKNGQASRYANYFDIDWDINLPPAKGKLVFNILEKSLEQEISSGRIHFEHSKLGKTIKYYNWEFPVSDQQISLEHTLRQQNYFLVPKNSKDYFRNYRCFFDVMTLARLRIEENKVFEASHRKVIEWFKKGIIGGFRIDHFEGLTDPGTYLNRLEKACPGVWIIVEKYFLFSENSQIIPLLDGTVGCDFLFDVERVMLSRPGINTMRKSYADFTKKRPNDISLSSDYKKAAIEKYFFTDLKALARLFRLCLKDKSQSENFIAKVLAKLISSLPVRRIYKIQGKTLSNADKDLLHNVVRGYKSNNPSEKDILRQISRILNRKINNQTELIFIDRFQQLSVAAVGKYLAKATSIESSFSSPGQEAITIEEFHQNNHLRGVRYPYTLSTLSTHDSSKSEDVRARIGIISEIPDIWRDNIYSWLDLNKKYRTRNFPGRDIESFYYLIIMGSWPISCSRILFQVQKAAHDAGIVAEGEDEKNQSLEKFVKESYCDEAFINQVKVFVKQIKDFGYVNSMSQTLLKLTSPGVPDTYQGTEIWDFSLADPDNRRLVDYSVRNKLLSEMQKYSIEEIWDKRETGIPKLWLHQKVLSLRKKYPEWFGAHGSYRPIYAKGEMADHVISFIRDGHLITIAPRLVVGLGGDWQNTKMKLPKGKWREIFSRKNYSGGETRIAELLDQFPIALLVKEK